MVLFPVQTASMTIDILGGMPLLLSGGPGWLVLCLDQHTCVPFSVHRGFGPWV